MDDPPYTEHDVRSSLPYAHTIPVRFFFGGTGGMDRVDEVGSDDSIVCVGGASIRLGNVFLESAAWQSGASWGHVLAWLFSSNTVDGSTEVLCRVVLAGASVASLLFAGRTHVFFDTSTTYPVSKYAAYVSGIMGTPGMHDMHGIRNRMNEINCRIMVCMA